MTPDPLCPTCHGLGYDITIIYHGQEPRLPCPTCVAAGTLFDAAGQDPPDLVSSAT